MRLIGRIFLWFFAVIGFGAVMVAVIGVGVAVFYFSSEPEMPERIVLRLDLEGGIGDGQMERPWDALLDRKTVSLYDVIAVLQRAATDDRVAGIAVQLSEAPIGIVAAQELRQGIADFRASGKFAMGFAASFEGPGNVMSRYMLASALDSVWMQPSGTLALTGISLEMPFIRNALDTLGVQAEFEQRHEYKSAAELFTRTGMSEPARQSLEGVVQTWMRQILQNISIDRNIPEEQLRALVERAPLLAKDAHDHGLLDVLGYRDGFEAAVQARAGDNAYSMSLDAYAGGLAPLPEPAANVALIYGVGPIESGGGENGVFSDATFSAEAFNKALTRAADDPAIHAIILRIDSPGGSYIASDSVRRTVMRAREKGKVVIASMGAFAASGGYFAAMAADRIVAQPGTLTGSIGVFGGKFATEDLWKKLGITWDQVSTGGNAGMWSGIRPFSVSEAARHRAIIDSIYADFTNKVAIDRNIPAERIDAIARGRVWTGEDARELGLVDALGGLSTAIDLAREALDLTKEAPLAVLVLPERRSPLDRALSLLEEGGSISDIAAALGGYVRTDPYEAVLRKLEPVTGDLDAFRTPAGVLQLPTIRIAP